MEARNKLESEALLEEQKVILGWLIDFRHLLIRLPENKFVAWSEAIRKMIKDEFSTAKDIARSPGPTSLHEATEGPTYNRQKETLRQNQLRMPKRPRDIPRISKLQRMGSVSTASYSGDQLTSTGQTRALQD